MAPLLIDRFSRRDVTKEAWELTERWRAERLNCSRGRRRAGRLAPRTSEDTRPPGNHREAERLAREAVAIMATSDYLEAHASAVADLGEVLHIAGKLEESAVATEEAIRMYERKGNLVVAGERRAHLAERRLKV